LEKARKSQFGADSEFSIAPMMDWTDRHCRFFHRVMTRRSQLFTEMVVADAVIHGKRDELLGFHPAERPLALQLGGSDPAKLAMAARIACDYGYDEINLNVGCPSDRVQSGAFGASLMLHPELVGECVFAMKNSVRVPVSVKCRLGVDDQDTGPALDALATSVWQAGADRLWVHARKAWLSGLSPSDNRTVPPLDYGRVRRLKADNPERWIGLNGGLTSLEQAAVELVHDVQLDGIMLGRAAYRSPGLLRSVDNVFFGDDRIVSWGEIIDAMTRYAGAHIANGGRLNHVTRHMIGLFQGMPGARRWRQILSCEAVGANAPASLIGKAFAAVDLDGVAKAA
jgi:tRNA-dihydrouridine synthase A